MPAARSDFPDFPVSPALLARLTGAVKADSAGVTTSRQVDPPIRRTLEDRFRAGEPAALDELVRTYEPQLRRLVYRLSGWTSTDVDDIVQETFVAAVMAAHKFDGRSSLGTWLTRVAINRCHTERRKRLLRTKYWKRLLSGRRVESCSEPAAADQAERATRVTDAVRRLPAKYREVIVLRYLEGMEIADVATVLRISRPAVEVRLSRARDVLRTTLGDLWKE